MYCAGRTPATPGGIPGTILLAAVFTDILLELDTIELADRPRPDTELLLEDCWPTPP